ncbi:hypothetical protein DFA_10591 [Cavenderia fasciculata]|uniref:Enhancer of mRNA-decapping protein 4 WD40 repeat region domain-containing protein n=1 Tax=Cavenderia fasciculata TaxID=261658 RepID=F4QAM9_CACFS|nr:uncharacterized protein DFA_10591 [Cavenderia fasciculata]EGG15748.1 hypothetical protein DFA_10591 [Cavenderia fasciculata]|eukprot:XP_004354495.1 hypothetical protein DFA_10591 [Cavenderia fasciculata]
MNNGLHKLFQSVMNINNQNQQQQDGEQQQQETSTSTTTTTTTNEDENNVMRFFNKLTPPTTNPTTTTTNTQQPSPPIEQQQQQQEMLTPSKKPLKSSIGGGVLPNLSFEQSNNITTSHNGVYLNGNEITIDQSIAMKYISDLESQTITIIPSSLKYLWGRLISVNNNYICYAVKGEKIRVLERSSSQKALIKDIVGTITDMQFFNDQSNLLACVTDSGALYVYDIESNPSTAGAISTQLCLFSTTAVSADVNPQMLPKVCWCGPTRIAIGGSGVAALSIVDFSTSQQQPSILSIAVQAGANINALAYNPSNSILAYGGANGSVGLIDLNATSLKSSTTSLSTEEIHFVSFIGQGDHLIVASRGNRDISVVKIDGWKVVQKVTIQNGGDQPCLLNSVDQYLFVIHTGCSRGYVLHFDQQLEQQQSTSETTPHFDYITEFDVKKPVLSYTVKSITSTPVARTSMREERKEKKFTIYSVQGHAILFHSIQLSQAYLESDIYNDRDGQTIGQKLTAATSVAVSSPPLPPATTEQDILELLTPGKLLVNIPSSPPPVSLPDPTKDLKDLLSSTTTNVSSLKSHVEVNISPENGDEKSIPSPSSSSNKKKKVPKSQLTKQHPSSELLPSPKSSVSPSISESDLTSVDQLLSPASLVNQTTSPTITKKNNNGTSSPQPIKKEKELTSATTTTTTTSPPVSVKPKSKTPSIRPTPLQIPTVNPPSSSGGSSLSLSNQSILPTTVQPIQPTIQSTNQQPSPTLQASPIITSTPPPPQQSTTTIVDPIVSSSSSSKSTSTSSIDEQMITNLIQTTIKSNLEKMVKKEVVPVLYSLEKSLGVTFEQLVGKIVQESVKKIGTKSESILKTSLDGLNSQLKTSTVTEAIESTIKQQIEAVFLEYFGQVLVPGFEKSCMTMFKHISVVFERGLVESSQQFQLSLQAQQLASQVALTEQLKQQKESTDLILNGLLQQQQQMQTDMKQLMNIIQFQQHQLQQQQHQTSAPSVFPTSTNNNNMSSPHQNMMNLYNSPGQQQQQQPNASMFPQHLGFQQQQPQQPQQTFSPTIKPVSSLIYPELKIFIESGDYSSAFNFALNASNLTMVVDLCSVLDPTEVYGRKNLQNPTIISLIQQLSFDLNNETDLKLKWIKESIFQLDPNHTSIAEIVRKVLLPIKLKIESQPHILAKEYYTHPILSALKIILK